jgi:hypothetical protein
MNGRPPILRTLKRSRTRPQSGSRAHRQTRLIQIVLIIAVLTGVTESLHAQIFGIRISQLYVSAMPVWIYNGFTQDADGQPVQGSDVSPLRMSYGAGFELRLTETLSVEPEGWLYLQEYISLDAYPTVVPTQIETGSSVGEIARTIGLALSVPVVYTLSPAATPNWQFDGSAGLAFIYRIPIGGIDGSSAGEVGTYWIAGRFIYPNFGVSADYRFSDRLQVGAGLTWFVPIYNTWGRTVEKPFLDGTMLRYGLRVRWLVGRQ